MSAELSRTGIILARKHKRRYCRRVRRLLDLGTGLETARPSKSMGGVMLREDDTTWTCQTPREKKRKLA
jgi:RNase P subunit RPR2